MNLSDYAIDFRHPIGHGQFGSVYRGWSKQLGRWIAVKQVPLNQSPAKIRAEREGAKNQRKFAHVHKNLIPEVFDDGVAGSAYWIAMELIEGEPLSSLILKRSLSPVRSVRIAAGIADFLRRAHTLNLFHSDLKPQHILIGRNDSIRIIDFGIMTEGEASSTSETNPFASREYASPERLLTGRISRSAEYWSLGVMLYEMLCGFHPYGQIRPNDLERAIVDGHRMAPMPDTVPLELQAVVSKMLTHRVESRYTDASLATDFDNYLNGRPTTAALAKRRAGATTMPVPPGRHTPAEPVAATAPVRQESSRPTVTNPEPAAARQPWFWRAVGVATLFLVFGLLVSESAVWVRAGGFVRRIPAMESSDVASARTEYASIRRLSVFGLGLRYRVHQPLRDRMLALAERTIASDRPDSPTVTQARWRQAAVCIALAADLAPGDTRVESVRKVIDGRLRQARATIPAAKRTPAIEARR